MFVSFDFLCSCFPLFCCKQMCLEAVDCWLWTSSVPIWKMNKTVVVAGCVIAGSAQLLKPCHIHHIPQTDRQAGRPTRLGPSRGRGGAEGGLFGLRRDWGGCFLYVFVPRQSGYPLQTTFTFYYKPSCSATTCSPCKHVDIHGLLSQTCWQWTFHIQTYTNKHPENLVGRQEPEWPIFSRFSLMSAIKSAGHQYFSALVRQAAIFFPFEEAHQRCFVFPRLPLQSYVNSASKKISRTGLLVDCGFWEKLIWVTQQKCIFVFVV